MSIQLPAKYPQLPAILTIQTETLIWCISPMLYLEFEKHSMWLCLTAEAYIHSNRAISSDTLRHIYGH